jgi:predicted amino acid dehydrogenase
MSRDRPTPHRGCARADLTVIEGGRVALPDPAIRFGVGNLQNLPDGITLACLAETILLALEGESRDCGIGDDVALAEVDRVLALAARHGFRLAGSVPAPIEERQPAALSHRVARESETGISNPL